MKDTGTRSNNAAKASRNAEKTRANILTVARDEFVDRGYSGARIDDIAAKTDTSKRMIYYYFTNKEGLYREVLRASYDLIRDAERQLDLGESTPTEALCRLVRTTMHHHMENPQYVRLIMIENIHHGRFVRQLDQIASSAAAAVDLLARIYADGCKTGEFRPGLKPIDLHWLISALAFFSVSNEATFGFLFQRFLDEREDSPATHLAEAVVMRFVTDSRRI